MLWPYDHEPEQLGKLCESDLDAAIGRHFAGPRQGRAAFRGLGYQGRWLDAEPLDKREEAAHPISEFIEEQTEPPPGRHVPRWEWIRNRWVGIGASLFWSLAVIAGIAAAAVSWPAH